MELEYCNSTVKSIINLILICTILDQRNRKKQQTQQMQRMYKNRKVHEKTKIGLKNREKRSKRNTRKNNYEKEQNIQKLGQDSNEMVQNESEDNRKLRRLKKSKDNVQEDDSFMNEKSSQVKNKQNQKQNKSQVFKVFGQRNEQGGNEMVLVAEVSDDESSSSSENEGQERAARPKQGKSKSKKKVKGKSIQIIKRKNIRQQHLNEEDVIQSRNRPKQRKNYQQAKISPVKERVRLNFNTLNKEVLKIRKNENILIGSVISEGFVGPYRHFEVRLRNGEKVYIRQKEMMEYFPAKLEEYRQRILNKVSKSTSRLNFVV